MGCGGQEVIVVELGHFLDSVHFFAYRNHITSVFEDCYNSGQCATPTMSFFEKVRTFVMKYERHMSAGALAGGFLVDTLTFQRIDFLFGHVMLFAYLFIAGASILFINARAAGRWTNRFSEKTAPFFPVS